MRKQLKVAISLVCLMMFIGCSASPVSQQTTKITLLNSKSEIKTQLEELAKQYNQEHPEASLEIITAPEGTSAYQKLMSMYGSGSPATMSMLDPGDTQTFLDKAVDLSKEKWVADTIEHGLDTVKKNDTVLGFPFAVEGYGLIYNKKVLDKAAGGTFDASSVNSRSSLNSLMAKIQKSGVAPVMLSPMDWSLGSHLLALAYSVQPGGVPEFVKGMQNNSIDLSQNNIMSGWVQTLDLLKDNNINKHAPLDSTYEDGSKALGEGKVGLWFMGNWAWNGIKSNDTANEEYGFLPLPLNDNTDDPINSKITVGVTKYIFIDSTTTTPQQQEEAKKFLNWLVYEKSGQELLVNKVNVIPAFKNIDLVPSDPLSKSIKSYMSSGKTLPFMATLPPDHGGITGASIQSYISGKIDKAELLRQIRIYWKAQQG
ncbi:ABC transporter substrate-binding protein [Paenibacillus ottowii]|uniref:Carbohydrate ABC transporter substrate-binding protein n=1 Tax=Paenibacillus ottowii TaxID=2315729 RepID=A0ABY3B4H5_9BACL|nr:ABC transporter substrate-binding protein [Paenibacillus ottowii]NEU25244.1 carbohydrate ABC transporter substrate-binding protein [Paenibacillus polymyxa]TQR98772.1 carbohydrate ABC transporter substrate-binding protein [Paenibacillus ottowii]